MCEPGHSGILAPVPPPLSAPYTRAAPSDVRGRWIRNNAKIQKPEQVSRHAAAFYESPAHRRRVQKRAPPPRWEPVLGWRQNAWASGVSGKRGALRASAVGAGGPVPYRLTVRFPHVEGACYRLCDIMLGCSPSRQAGAHDGPWHVPGNGKKDQLRPECRRLARTSLLRGVYRYRWGAPTL